MGLAFILLSALHPTVDANAEIIIPSESVVDIVPIVTGGISVLYTHEAPFDLCIANDGTIFVVSANPFWQLIRGASSASFIAWRNDGSLPWAQRFTSWDRVLYAVATDDTHVFVAGGRSTRLFVAKYTMDGANIWNVTRSIGNITYGCEMGTKLSLLEDGTIIAIGISQNYSDSTYESFIAAYDQDGVYQWSETFPGDPTICCDSNSIYITTNETIQRRDSTGSIVWESAWHGDRPIHVASNLLYTMQVQGIPHQASVDLAIWNLPSSEEIWASNFRLCNDDHQVYNSTACKLEVTPDGSMLVLIGVRELSEGYLLQITPQGQLTSRVNRINMTMSYNTQLEVDTEGYVYLAGVSAEGNLTVEKYDTSIFDAISTTTSIPTGEGSTLQPSNTPLMTIVAVGVIGFDILLIIFLKKRI